MVPEGRAFPQAAPLVAELLLVVAEQQLLTRTAAASKAATVIKEHNRELCKYFIVNPE